MPLKEIDDLDRLIFANLRKAGWRAACHRPR
jgi:hypothetical protein